MKLIENTDHSRALGANGWVDGHTIRYGENTPAELRARGVLTENGYSSDRAVTTNTDCEAGYLIGGRIYGVYDGSAGTFGASWAWSASDPRQPGWLDVLPKLASQWRGTEFNLGVTLIEGHESLNTIINGLLALYHSLRALRKGNFGDALKYLAARPTRSARGRAYDRMQLLDHQGAWLELSFGWLPIIHDIYNASQYVKTGPKVGVIRSSHTEKAKQIPSVKSGWRFQHRHERRFHVKVKVINAPSELQRIGLANPALAFWEGIPWSFFVDYFIPIGAFLDSAHIVNAMRCEYVVATGVRDGRGKAWCERGDIVNRDWYMLTPGHYETVVNDTNRTIYAGLPTQLALLDELVPRVIRPSLDLSLMRLANAYALFSRQARG